MGCCPSSNKDAGQPATVIVSLDDVTMNDMTSSVPRKHSQLQLRADEENNSGSGAGRYAPDPTASSLVRRLSRRLSVQNKMLNTLKGSFY